MSTLTVGVVSGILNPRYGGPPAVIRGHIAGLGDRARVRVFGVADPGDVAELAALYPGCELYPRAWPGRWFRGRGLRRGLARALPGLDVVHAHMLWDHPVWAAGREALRAGKPFGISPHGNILNVGRLWPPHKVLYRDLVLRPLLRSAAFVHALTGAEAEACRRFGVECPIRVIPNGLPAGDYDRPRDPSLALETWPALKGRRVLLFMGRLAPLKGLDLLLEAYARLRRRGLGDWILVAAGHDYRGYAARVAAMVRGLGLEGSVVLPGPVRGDLKDSLLGASQAFVLPSRVEGFSVALLEAMAAGLPCVITTECYFRELALAGAAWEAPAEVGPLAEVLGACLGKGPDALRSAGLRGKALGRERYTLDAVADQLLELYTEAARSGR